jgi:non-heme chloroperoxidase
MKKYPAIPVHALAIFADPHGLGDWVDHNTDPTVRQAAQAYTSGLSALVEKQLMAFRNGVPAARVVVLPGAHHYVYLSNEPDVLREMRAFLTSLH